MINIELLKKSDYFKEKTLKNGEILFDEGDIDNNLYYILEGELSIEKYVNSEKSLTKQLATIEKKDFFGEGALNNSEAKQVKIISTKETKLLYIDAKIDFLKFMKENPEEAKNILVYIISITNKRTLTGNKYITSIHEINKSINEVEKIDYKEIFKIFDKINSILESEFLLFLETNPIDENFLKLKYDSRKQGKMQDILLEKSEYKLESIGISSDYQILNKDISIAGEKLGNIILVKKNIFNQNEERIFGGIINSLSGILKQKKIQDEERNINFNII